MKKTIVVTALVAAATLSACKKDEPAVAPAATETAATPTEVMAADGKSPVGKFVITTSDGKVINEELKADGTYEDTLGGKVVETGTWVQKAPGTFCYTNAKAGSKEICNSEQVDDKGVWTTINPDKKTSTVVRVEA
jgi:hypothetical protein